MTFIHVDIVDHTHTCPADPQPHTIDRQRTIAAIVDGGPCRQPITIGSGDDSTVIACGRRLPHDEQCPACRITVIERSITTIPADHRPQYPHHSTTGTAA